MAYSIKVTFEDSSATNVAGSLSVVGDMPALVGSEKQVAWANDIRKSFARELAAEIASVTKVDFGVVLPTDTDFIAEVEAAIADKLNADESGKKVQAAIAKIFANTSAKYWIDDVRPSSARVILIKALRP